jgi:hypothetical protein
MRSILDLLGAIRSCTMRSTAFVLSLAGKAKAISDDKEAFRRLERGAEFFHALESLAGYRLPEMLDSLFRRPCQRAWLSWKNAAITPSAREREWHLRVHQHLEEARQTTCAALYHIDNVVRIEAELDALIAQFRDALEAQDGAGRYYSGVTSKLSFEYHAFAFSAVRMMNHISKAAGQLFGKRLPNLKSLEKYASGHHEANRFRLVLNSHKASIEKLFSRGEIRSVRDRIAHDEFLFAGSLQIVQGKACQSGPLKPDFEAAKVGQEGIYRLSEIMRSQFAVVERFLVDIVAGIDGALPRIDGR